MRLARGASKGCGTHVRRSGTCGSERSETPAVDAKMVDTAKTPQILEHVQQSLNLTVYDTKYVAPQLAIHLAACRPRACPPCSLHASNAASAHRTPPRSTLPTTLLRPPLGGGPGVHPSQGF